MSADILLQRLEVVRETGPGRWLAKCPAHADRSPSLSVRQLDDGRVLIHDFAGCGAQEVLAAVGLGMEALFPPRDPATHSRRKAPPPPFREVLLALRDEAVVVLLAAGLLERGSGLCPEDHERLATAVARLDRGCRFVRSIR